MNENQNNIVAAIFFQNLPFLIGKLDEVADVIHLRNLHDVLLDIYYNEKFDYPGIELAKDEFLEIARQYNLHIPSTLFEVDTASVFQNNFVYSHNQTRLFYEIAKYQLLSCQNMNKDE